ncbi:MAG: rubredoxin [Candidatus Babeliales bacterium]
MNTYICTICSFIYDDETAPRDIEGKPVQFEDIENIIDSDEINNPWKCPNCGAKKRFFKKINPGKSIKKF